MIESVAAITRGRASVFQGASWAPTVGLSWLWGFAFFFVFDATLSHGWTAAIGFGLTYALGLLIFGGVLGDGRRNPAEIFRALQSRYMGLFLAVQILIVAAIVFATTQFLLLPLLGVNASAGTAVVVLLATAIGHSSSIKSLKTAHIGYLIVGFTVAVWLIPSLARLGVHGGADQSHGSGHAEIVIPVVLALLVGPWTDVRQWQYATAIRQEGCSVRKAYGWGAMIFAAGMLLNAILASALAPTRGFVAFDGQRTFEAAAIEALGAGRMSALEIAYIVWAGIAMVSAVSSFYLGTGAILRATTAASNSPVLALVPVGLVTSPIWFLITAIVLAACAVIAAVPLVWFLVPFATLFVGQAGCLVCEALSGRHRCDPVLCVLIGLASLLVFLIGCLGAVPLLIAVSPLIGLIGALPAVLDLSRRSAAQTSAAAEAAETNPALPLQTIKVPPGDVLHSHGFDGQWFVLHLTPTYDDTNAVGNVYFANYFRWVGKARELFFNACMPDFDLQTTGFYILTKSFAHEFRREIREFHPVSVRVRIASYNRKFVTIVHEIHSVTDGLIGRGEQSIMFVDPSHQRPLDIPPLILQRFLPYYTPNPAARVAAESITHSSEA